jgi:hypothetical protein
MAAVPTLGQVRQMVTQAMRDRAPTMYAELLATGELEQVIQERVDLFDQTFSSISMEVNTKALTSNLPFQEHLQMLEQGDRSAVEQALAVALEFPVERVHDDE